MLDYAHFDDTILSRILSEVEGSASIQTCPFDQEGKSMRQLYVKPLNVLAGHQVSSKRLNSSFFIHQFISQKIFAEYRGLPEHIQ